MSEMDNQGTLPSYVEPGRRQSPKAQEADGGQLPDDDRDDQQQRPPERPSPSEPPFEPSTEAREQDAAPRRPDEEG